MQSSSDDGFEYGRGLDFTVCQYFVAVRWSILMYVIEEATQASISDSTIE